MIDTLGRGCELIEKLIDLNTHRVFKVTWNLTFHALDSLQNINVFIFFLELKQRLNFDDRFKDSLDFSFGLSLISSYYPDLTIFQEVN